MAIDADPQIDWHSRNDGEVHILVKGKHYTRSETKVRHAATVWAHRRNLRALSELTEAGIRIQFVPKGRV